MELKLHPLRQNVLNVKSAHESANISLCQAPYGDGITIQLMGGEEHKKGVEILNKIRIIENEYGLIEAQVFSKDSVCAQLKDDEKIIWSNF